MDQKPRTAVTHNGVFHADDVFAAATLTLLFPDIQITRSRDESVIADADIVFDVGMIYDESKLRFDHHQEEGAGKRENGIPYSSFGLIWKHFGNMLCKDEKIMHDVDTRLVSYIDAYDNGIGTMQLVDERYPQSYSIGDLISLYKPHWKDTSEQTLNEGFFEAVMYAKSVLLREIKRVKGRHEAREYILSVYKRAQDKKILIFDTYLPWDETVSALPEPLFVVYPNSSQNGDWCAQVVRDNPTSYSSDRINFPLSWAGKREDELEKITGVQGAVFSHRNRFFVVAHTKEAVLALVREALKEAGRIA